MVWLPPVHPAAARVHWSGRVALRSLAGSPPGVPVARYTCPIWQGGASVAPAPDGATGKGGTMTTNRLSPRLTLGSLLVLSLLLIACNDQPPPTATSAPPTRPPTPLASPSPSPAHTASPLPRPTPRPIPTAMPDASRWKTFIRADPVTDQWQSGLRLASTDAQGELVIRCTPSQATGLVQWDVYIAWDEYLALEGTVVVWTRYDEEPAIDTRWGLSTSRTGTFAPEIIVTGQRGIITKLQQTNRFIARVVRYNETTLTKTWRTEGLTVALRPLVERCQARATSG